MGPAETVGILPSDTDSRLLTLPTLKYRVFINFT
jgi:hypothetical protein